MEHVLQNEYYKTTKCLTCSNCGKTIKIWDRSEKWCIRLWGNAFEIGITTNISRFLTFPTKEMAREFLECFKDLIEKARDLI